MTLESSGTVKSINWPIHYFLLIMTGSDLLAWIGGFIFISYFQRILICAYAICLYGRIFVICTIPSGSAQVKIGKKIGTHTGANINAYPPRARSISLTRKSIAALSEPFIANSHASSYRQSHNTLENEDTHANEGRQKKT